MADKIWGLLVVVRVNDCAVTVQLTAARRRRCFSAHPP